MKKIFLICIITFLTFIALSACSSNKYDIKYERIQADVKNLGGRVIIEDEKLLKKFEKMANGSVPDENMILKMSDMLVQSHFGKRAAKDIFKRYTDIEINQYNNYFIIYRYLEGSFEGLIQDGEISMAISSDFKKAYTGIYYDDMYEFFE